MSSSDPSSSSPKQRRSQAPTGSWRDPRGRLEPEQDGDAVQPGTAAKPSAALSPGLYVVSTPIGNLRDITLRALDTLAGVDEILAEDTRMARKLLDAFGIKAEVTPYHDHNGAQRRPAILDALEDGARIALVSDAGTPLVSDPGFKLVRAAAEAGLPVIPVPGASALLAGLVAAGLPSDRFLFTGFLPPKSGARRKALSALKGIYSTLIAYESGPRLSAMLSDAAETLGPERAGAVARELTKRFEETRRGSLGDLAAHYESVGAPKGEIVVLIGPPDPTSAGPGGAGDDLEAYLRTALADLPVKAASEAAAEALGVPRRVAYQRALAIKASSEG